MRNAGGTLILTDSSVSDNRFNSGIANGGTARITHSTISGNRAEGFFYAYGGATGAAGGGIHNFGTLNLTNSTVSDNTVTQCYGQEGWGGGIFNTGTLTLIHSTVSGNAALCEPDPSGPGDGVGGGVFNYGGTLTLVRTLVSGNTASHSGPEIEATGLVTANNFNLFGHDGQAGVVGFRPGVRDIMPDAPLPGILLPLADNGGGTLTQALAMNSPALDAAPAGNACPPTDQRGETRPQGARCDIGAFEGLDGAVRGAGQHPGRHHR